MKHPLRVRTCLLVAGTPVICSLLCSVARAQPSVTEASSSNASVPSTAPTPEPNVPPASSEPNPVVAPEQRGPMHVAVTLIGYDLTAETVTNAIARDLGLSLTPDVGLARCRFVLQVERGKDLALTFYGTNGLELKRVVRAPEANADVGEVAALLAVNLVRDEAPELLPLLTPKPPEAKPAEEAKPTQPKPAPAPVTKPVPVAPKPLPFIPANGSLVFPLTIMRDVDEHSVGFELGLVYSDVGAIDGAGINAVVVRTRNASHGALIAGAVSIAGQRPESAASGQPALSGIQVSGAASIASGKVDGVQIAGAASVAAGNVDGAQISGAANVSDDLEGFQAAGALNVANGNVEGFQAAGAINFAHGNVEGAQTSLVNVAKDVEGAQISLVNIGNNIDGAQIGLVNIGDRVKGAQIGLVNIADDVDGASIGMVTYSKKGQTQITTWFDSTRPLNLGVRFVTGPLYALPSVGTDPTTGDVFDFALSLGARIPVQRMYFDIDGNSRMSFDGGDFKETDMDLRYRLTAGFQVTSWLGVFAGGGVHHYFNTSDTTDQTFKPFWCAGVDLL